jgi:hypothetical protein
VRGFVSGFDIANTVKMSHTQRRVTFLLVEGTTDVTLFRKFVLADHCEVLPCFGRGNALLAVESLDKSGEVGWLAVVDADWDRLNNTEPSSTNCVLTDGHDILVDLLCSRALDHVLGELGSADKIADFEKASGTTVRANLLAGAATVGRLRWHNERASLSLKFRDLELHPYVVGGCMRIDFVALARVIVQRSGSNVALEVLQAGCDDLAAGAHDDRQVAVGHDAVALLGSALRGLIGSQKAQDVRPDVLERELRLAFDKEELERTKMHARMLQWEEKSGWPIFVRPTNDAAPADT